MATPSDPIPSPPSGGRPRPTFSEVALDRGAGGRADAAWLDDRLHAPDSRAVALAADGVLLEAGGDRLARLPLPELAADALDSGAVLLLGLEQGRALFALDLGRAPAPAGRIVGLRDAGAVLPGAEAGLAAYATALVNWHRHHRFCANCGAATVVHEGGQVRRCPVCKTSHFPRTDPVVIMLVESERGLLLGRRPGWPAGRYSLLAGFVAPGETAEDAVVREVREESGIEAYAPRFVASQPWPFPASLMLGFEARADGGDAVPRDGELEHVGWFPYARVRAALAGEDADGLVMPPSIAIARFIIERRLRRDQAAVRRS